MNKYGVLFKEYLRVCNEALAAHKHCFPYDRIVHKIEFALKCHSVEVFIYDKDENNPEAIYNMTLDDGLLTAKPSNKPHAKHPWRLSKYFLEQVALHPGNYIYNPAQLDWKWLTHSAGV